MFSGLGIRRERDTIRSSTGSLAVGGASVFEKEMDKTDSPIKLWNIDEVPVGSLPSFSLFVVHLFINRCLLDFAVLICFTEKSNGRRGDANGTVSVGKPLFLAYSMSGHRTAYLAQHRRTRGDESSYPP